jgi:hypothetical protein
MATPVSRVAAQLAKEGLVKEKHTWHIPTSREADTAPRARKKEYIVIVRMKMSRNWIKNWDGVRERFAILGQTVSVKVHD